MRTGLLLALTLVIAACDPAKPPAAPPTSDPVARARALLAEAGFPGGKGFPKLEVLYNTAEEHKKIAAAIQQMWNANLGIEVTLRNTEWKVYLDDLSKLRYEIVRRGWIGDYRDPNTFIELFTAHSKNNNTGWTDPEYDRLVKEAAAEPDRLKRFETLARAEKILLHDLPILPLYYYVTPACWKDSIQGLYSNIQDIHPLNEVHIPGQEILSIGNGTEIQTLDPGLARGVPEHRIQIGLFEGLVNPDPKTLDPVPGVAEKWEISPDGKKYTFHLRDCAWSDGRKVVAGDFVYAWTRVLDPATPTDYAHILHLIKGAEAFNTKKTTDPSTVGILAKDHRTLEVELEAPCTYFLEICAFFTCYPVRRDVIEKHGTEWTKTEHFVGNGPFRLLERKPTDSTTLEKNPRYWNAARVKQPRIKFLPHDNRQTAWSLYTTGACDWITALPIDFMDEIVKRPDYRGDTYLGTYFYSFNITKPPLNDRRVRLALALAVDRDIIVSKITKQGQKPAFHFTPPAWPDYKSPRFDAKE